MTTPGRHSVTRTATVPTGAEVVWSLVRDFAAIDRWMPGIDSVTVRPTGPVGPGTERVVTAGGAEFVERLVEVREDTMRLVYELPDPPFALTDHRAELIVARESADTCTVTWTADFLAEPGDVAGVDDAMGGAFSAGLGALVERYGRTAAGDGHTVAGIGVASPRRGPTPRPQGVGEQ